MQNEIVYYTDREKDANSRKDCICWREGLKSKSYSRNSSRKRPDIHQPNTTANGSGKGIQDVHGRGDPFCESVVTVLGSIKLGYSLSKDGEDSLG